MKNGQNMGPLIILGHISHLQLLVCTTIDSLQALLDLFPRLQAQRALCLLPGNLRAFQMTMVLSTLQEANHTSWGDQATSITSAAKKTHTLGKRLPDVFMHHVCMRTNMIEDECNFSVRMGRYKILMV